MTAVGTRITLRIAAVAVAAAGVAVLVAGAIAPLKLDAPATPVTVVTHPASTQPTTDEVDLSEFLDVDLHRPLVDPKPATTLPAMASADLLQGLRLVGTAMETGHTFAVFTTTAGKTDIKSVGESVAGGTVTAITADSVSIRINGRTTTLHAVKPPSLGQLRP